MIHSLFQFLGSSSPIFLLRPMAASSACFSAVSLKTDKTVTGVTSPAATLGSRYPADEKESGE